MKMGLKGESDWTGSLAVMLARAGDNVQADFFHAFVAECLSWGYLNAESQLAMVNAKLSGDEKALLSMLGYTEDGR